MFHPLVFKTLPRKLNDPFAGKPHRCAVQAFEDLDEWVKRVPNLKTELCRGKMVGVLVVKNAEGESGYLAAFSGQVMSANYIEGFVPPVFDILADGSYFLEGEREITEINRKLRDLASNPRYSRLKNQLRLLKTANDGLIQEKKEQLRIGKEERDRRRAERVLTPEENEELNRQSARAKSELKKLTEQLRAEEAKIEAELRETEAIMDELKRIRIEKSAHLQNRIFRDFRFVNQQGKTKNLLDIFGANQPPSGAGECCAPRLLNYAFLHNMKPLALAEFWMGASPDGKVRHHGTYYHACRSKCLPILSFMLEGVAVERSKAVVSGEEETIRTIYIDSQIAVISKPSGMLSVRGKEETEASVEVWAEKTFPTCDRPMIVHRLDQDTSGIMVLALTKEAHLSLQRQFEERTVRKRYVAVLKGRVSGSCGTISLPLAPDLSDRPMQMVSAEGAEAVTEWRVVKRTRFRTRIEFLPHTGRTHQLRVHASSPLGLGCPIIGDRLYSDKKDKSRLLLHAEEIIFQHPSSGKEVRFTDLAPF